MPKRIAISTLHASTIDILNTIRANASYEYQSQIPVITSEHDIPKVGETIMGYPALANQFINALVNRIALVRVKSANFNNMYADLKKGYLENGETVEEVFVNIAKAREFSVEKAPAREFKRTMPDVRSAFHAMNWRVQYPVTIQNEDLKLAFTSINGVEDLIARIVDAVYTANEYDEFLLFKYLLIKAISHGKLYPVAVDASDMRNSAIAYRGTSNMLEFMKTEYNESGVHTTTKKADQHIFMDATYNANYDVNVLASAFNMDKADFMGRLRLIDDWTTFDSERFSIIMENSDQIDPITDDELALMGDVIGVLVDEEWFQVYDNLTVFSEQYVASGLYWNYFLNVWKTVDHSPFSNAVVFVKNTASISLPATIGGKVTEVTKNENDGISVIIVELDDTASLAQSDYQFVQTEEATSKFVAVQRYGAFIFTADGVTVVPTLEVGGTIYEGGTTLSSASAVGDTITFAPQA